MAFYLYFWLAAENDSNDFNWNFTVEFKMKHVPWYRIMLSLAVVAFWYLAILVGLSIYRISMGHEVHIHPFHVVMIIINFLSCIGYTIALNTFWPSVWAMLKLSFQV
ncbi:glycerophosphodiester phosphodiesterase domain-containing protein 5-like [Octopus sinensis]|uniref:Glycerophosphodiester phosphodiesterase domain-containing protein 5-like n=1 Tax=Octopus sinensis TaxID=2607531 RepID=A0A7E6EKD9_9MOLL|nr:glycerophosphodiester phosphodiesterase domain-containing protein 5-like [Octopus sinensis]